MGGADRGGRRLANGARVAIIGAGPAGCLLAATLLDAARARRRLVQLTVYDGGAQQGRAVGMVLSDPPGLAHLDAAGLALPSGACSPLLGVRTVVGGVEAATGASLFTAPRGDLSEADIGAFLRAGAVARGARLVARTVDGLSRAADGAWAVRAGGAAERADVVVLACGAGAPHARSLPAHVAPPVWRCCGARLELDPAAQRQLRGQAAYLVGSDGLSDLWVVPDRGGAQVLALGPEVGATELAETLLAQVIAGALPARFALRDPRRIWVAAGAARPAVPAIGDALGGLPGPSTIGRVVAQAQRLSAALLEGGDEGLLAACSREAREVGREARARHRAIAAFRRLPQDAVALAIGRQQVRRPERRHVARVLAAAAAPERAPRRPWLSLLDPRVLVALLLAGAVLLWRRLRGAPEEVAAGGPIYVVDDDPDQAALICSYLGARGLPCRSFDDGLLAAAAAARERPAAVVLDVALPWLDGPGVCRALKRTRATAGVPVLLATALPQALAWREGVMAGADAILAKPLDLDGLVRRLAPYAPGGSTSGEPPATRANGL